VWLLNVENGEARLKEWEQEPTVQCLSWTEEDPAAKSAARAPLVAPTAKLRCCHAPRSGPVDKGKPGAGSFSPEGRPPGPPELPSSLSVLCAGDEAAHVRLLAYGCFPLGHAAMPPAHAPARILHVRALILRPVLLLVTA